MKTILISGLTLSLGIACGSPPPSALKSSTSQATISPINTVNSSKKTLVSESATQRVSQAPIFTDYSAKLHSVNEALEQRQIRASAVLARICTREPSSSVTLRTGPGIDHPSGLVQVGSGGARVENYFQQRNYTVEDGEKVSVFSKTHGTDGRVWYEIGTNQWVAWVRSDFVCQSINLMQQAVFPKFPSNSELRNTIKRR